MFYMLYNIYVIYVIYFSYVIYVMFYMLYMLYMFNNNIYVIYIINVIYVIFVMYIICAIYAAHVTQFSLERLPWSQEKIQWTRAPVRHQRLQGQLIIIIFADAKFPFWRVDGPLHTCLHLNQFHPSLLLLLLSFNTASFLITLHSCSIHILHTRDLGNSPQLKIYQALQSEKGIGKCCLLYFAQQNTSHLFKRKSISQVLPDGWGNISNLQMQLGRNMET